MQALVEAGSLEGERGAYRLVRPVEEAAVPASVQAVLAARIDRLAQREKAVLQAAAVIGKEFSAPVLERVVELAPAELEDALREPRRGRVRLRAGALSRGALRLQAPADPGGGLRLAARRAARRRPRRGRARDRRARTRSGSTSARRCSPSTGRPPGETLEAARWHARAAAWSGTSDPAQALRHWRKVRELADALPESAETAALGLTARIVAARLRLAARHLARGGGGPVRRGGADGLAGGGPRARARSCSSATGWSGAVSDGDLREYARRSPRGDRARRGVRRPGALRGRGDHHLRPLLHRRAPRGPGDLRPRDRAGGRRPHRGRRHGGRLRRRLVPRAEGRLPDPPGRARGGAIA